MARQPEIASSEDLLAAVFGTRAASGTLRFHVCTIRKKLALHDADIVRTARSQGYYVLPLEDHRPQDAGRALGASAEADDLEPPQRAS